MRPPVACVVVYLFAPAEAAEAALVSSALVSSSGDQLVVSVEDPSGGGLLGYRETIWPSWGSVEYYASLKLNYKFRNHQVVGEEKDIFFRTLLRIDPCRTYIKTGGLGDRCCAEQSLVGCEDHPGEVFGGPDLQVAYFQNAHIPSCVGTPFEMDPNCGTTLEIHRKDQTAPIVADVRIRNDMPDGFQTTYISTTRADLSDLCVGAYELWFVVRTRAAPFVLARKDFVVKGPSCREATFADLDLFSQHIEQVTENPADSFGTVIGRALGGKNSTAPTTTGWIDAAASTAASTAATTKSGTAATPMEGLLAESNQRARENRRQGHVMGSDSWKRRVEARKKRRTRGSVQGNVYEDDLDEDADGIF